MRKTCLLLALLLLLSFTSSAGAIGPMMMGSGSNPIHLSRFTGADGTSIASATYTPDIGTGFTLASLASGGVGTLTISSNKAVATWSSGADFYGIATTEIGLANATITTDVTTGNAAAFADNGIAYRYSDANNLWWADIATASVANDVRIIENTASSITVRAAMQDDIYSAATTHALRLVLSGDLATFFVDGVQKLTYSSNVRNTVTRHGLFFEARDGVTGTKHDNFTVYP